jgi:hypothetical protein
MKIRIAALAVVAAAFLAVPANANTNTTLTSSQPTAQTPWMEANSDRKICQICPGRPRNVCRCPS